LVLLKEFGPMEETFMEENENNMVKIGLLEMLDNIVKL
jgi:hypothetical protein